MPAASAAPARTKTIGLLGGIGWASTERVQASGIRKVGLLGVRPSMAGSFYHDRLARHGIEVLTPSAAEQTTVHDIIENELVHNRIVDASRRVYAGILGCTEIPLLIGPADVAVPVFNTTQIHCEAAVAFALSA